MAWDSAPPTAAELSKAPAWDSAPPTDAELGRTKPQGLLEQAGRSAVNSLPMLGGVAGGILGTPMDAIAGPMGNVVGAGIGGYVGTAAKNAINHYIDPENAPQSNTEALTQPITGGITQAGMQAGGELAAPIIERAGSIISKPVSEYLAKLANKKAIAATGATGVQASKFADNAGQELLDRGIIGFGNNQEQIAKKASDALDQSGQGIGNTLKQLDSQGVKVDRNTVIKYIEDKIAALSKNEGEKPLVNQLKGKLADIQEQIPQGTTEQTGFYPSGQPIETVSPKFSNDAYFSDPTALKPARWISGSTEDRWAEMRGAELEPGVSYTPISPKYGEVPGDSTIPITQSEEIKRSFDQGAKWNSNADSAVRDANKIAANAYRSAGEDAATVANPQLASQFQADKDTFGLLSPVVTAAEKRAATTAQSPPGGFLDTATAAAGGVVAGAPGAIALPIARRVLAPRINSSLAVGSDWLAQAFKSAPQSFSRWAGPISMAINNGGNSLTATDYLLQSTDPEYRQHIQMLKNSQDNQNRSVANEGN